MPHLPSRQGGVVELLERGVKSLLHVYDLVVVGQGNPGGMENSICWICRGTWMAESLMFSVFIIWCDLKGVLTMATRLSDL